ncbi:MAG: hypothetical protein KBD78_07485 [Oligoflexales bacterium]|nr:hypothetical protein [Oligoflexales bacterium]
MNRRNFLHSLGQSSLAVSALSAVSAVALAQEVPSTNTDVSQTTATVPSVEITTEIDKNHGHELILTMTQYVALIRQTIDATGLLMPVVVDIQGLSGHAHALNFSQEDLVKILVDGEIELTSTLGAGHSHSVKISMLVTPVI